MTVTSNNEIKINPEYSSLVYPLSSLEYESLKDSIKNKGLQSSIVVNQKKEILDGHHRYKICQELGIEPTFEVKIFDNESEEQEFVIYINLNRRQLNDFQKAELAYRLEDLKKESARQRQLSQLRNVKDNISLGSNDHNDNDDENYKEKGRTIDIVSKKTGIKPKTYQRAKTIIQNGSEETKEKLRQGKTSISKEYDKIIKDEKRKELLSQYNQENNNDDENYKLLHGDFTKFQKEILDNSVDLILTDPPYGNESLHLYQDLAKLATRVLKPRGSLVTFVGHIIMDEVIKIFDKHSLVNDTGLKYWWIFAVKHSGNHTKIHQRNVFAEWKPMLWYVKKGVRANNLVTSNTMGDHIESKSPTKTLHEWEQSTAEAEYIIKNLTLENQIVLDPMMGIGTTGLAALKLKRRFIGIEIDKETYDIAKARITYLSKNNKPK